MSCFSLNSYPEFESNCYISTFIYLILNMFEMNRFSEKYARITAKIRIDSINKINELNAHQRRI